MPDGNVALCAQLVCAPTHKKKKQAQRLAVLGQGVATASHFLMV
jgi:hypothetical protein